LRELVDDEVVTGAVKLNVGAAGLSVDAVAGLLNEKGDGVSLVGLAVGGLNENGLDVAGLSDDVLAPNENGVVDAGLSEAFEVDGKLKPANGEGLSVILAG